MKIKDKILDIRGRLSDGIIGFVVIGYFVISIVIGMYRDSGLTIWQFISTSIVIIIIIVIGYFSKKVGYLEGNREGYRSGYEDAYEDGFADGIKNDYGKNYTDLDKKEMEDEY
ncbi:MAG: hypothetical protein A2452_12175 [Candidatus Firestonebacteria bacterium RIFOXYC2_FULL_39_67]|nr:MAG: hypothetical protein A2536_07705 [Candidatus Firestonebacteria bacterium RIFOXYD2_FULL_39_29]OGF55605.1 MAG: hypothetical protein A2452_12175 [Candidatus Firestonebacteria bacterium RIFOXYC2_FULL_39_67]